MCEASSLPDLETEEMRRRKALAQLRLLRPLTDHDLRAGQIEREKRFEVLLDRDAAVAQEDRTRQTETAGVSGVKASVSTPRPHIARLRKPRSVSSAASDGVDTIVTPAAAWKRRNAA